MATGGSESRVTRLAAIVRRTRGSLVATVLVGGLLLAAAIAISWVVGVVVLDIAAPLSVPGRQAAWCGWWAAVAAAIGLFLVAPAARWPLVDAVALRIERAIGDVHNQLLTVVDLARSPGSQGPVHGADGRVLRPDMVERLLDQTQERIRGFRSAQVLPWRTVLRNLAVAAAAVAGLAGLHVGLGERFRITLARLLDPTADIPPATWLQLRSPGDLDVLEGDPLEIRGSIVRGACDDVTLVIYDADGRPGRQPMRPGDDGTFVATLEGLDRPVRYRLEAGNTWTRTHAITILARPEIRSLTCRVRLPGYMRIDAALDVAAGATRIEPPEGSTVEFVLAASDEAVSGALGLFERSLTNEVVERYDDRVWFEDDLPRDAVTDAPWRWTTAHAAGGLRSFVLGAGDRPLNLRTRLEPLVLPRERPEARDFSLMGRIDASEPPTRLTVVLEHGQGRTELLWGDAGETKPPANASRIEAGRLPQSGDWTRLSVPLKSLGHLAGQSVTAATFAVDRGRMLLDRPGWMERSEVVVSRPVDTPVGEIQLVPAAADEPRPPVCQPDDGLWTGALPAAKPTWVMPSFRSRQGHASLPAQLLEIAPTIDRPPSIVVDAMPDAIVLKAAVDLPITGSGFDDWGIDEVCVLAGPDAARLEVRETLAGVSSTDRPPRTQLAIATAISSDMLGFAPGKSSLWKLRITDTKGQIAETKVYRVTVLPPPESDIAKTQVPALAQARREAMQLVREAARKAVETDAKRDSVREAVEAGETPPKRLVDELAARTERERRLADQLATSVAKAAAQAANSELVPQPEQEMLAELAADARALERQLAGSEEPKPETKPDAAPRADDSRTPAGSADDAPDKARESATKPEKEQQRQPTAMPGQDQKQAQDRKRDTSQASPQDKERMPRQDSNDRNADDASAAQPIPRPATSAQKAETAKAARVAEAPMQSAVEEAATTLARSLEEVEQRLKAQGVALQIDALADDLARRAEQLAEQAQRQPPAEESRLQPAAEQARRQVRDVEQILGTRFPPPATASKEDTQKEDMQKEAVQQKSMQKDIASEGAATKDTPMEDIPAKEASSPQQAAEPRAAGRPAVAAALAAAAAAKAANSTADLAERLKARPRSESPGQPSSEAGNDAARPEGVGELLGGDEVRRALAMAERARRLQAQATAEAEAAARAAARTGRARDTRTRGDADRGKSTAAASEAADSHGGSEGGAMTGDTAIAPTDALRGLDARQRAALYKLPPHIRDPLLDGMRQRGPEAYQGVIDTYFRQLGRDIPQ